MDQNKKSTQSDWTTFVGKGTKLKIMFMSVAFLVSVTLIVVAIFSASGNLNGNGNWFRSKGRIVIAADSKSINGLISATFERCRYLIIYDLGTNKYKAIANPYFSDVNPGDKTARFIADRAEEAVLTGNIGPLAYQTLENLNIQVYLVPKIPIRQAIEKYLDGKLVHMEVLTLYGYTPSAPISATPVAWQAPVAAGPREAVCPICQLKMPIGAHIQTNRIMCPYCPGQAMQINEANAPGQQSFKAQAGFIPGGGAVDRGVVILK